MMPRLHWRPSPGPNIRSEHPRLAMRTGWPLTAAPDLKAIQELLGHLWLATTSGYIHVRSDHIERAWEQANERVEDRFGQRRLPGPGTS